MNLENPWYLLIPVLSVVGLLVLKKTQLSGRELSKIADPHLLKYIVNIPVRQNFYKYAAMWVIIALISLALANPRWGEREYKLYSGNAAAVIVLDVSNHMGCQDVRPTRAVRARQIASEIVKSYRQVNFGLLAFAKNTHLIAPITDDAATLNNYLPALDYKLIYQQGQELDSSLALAEQMLANENSAKKAIILLSAGNFNLTNFSSKYPVYVIGVGTEQGAPMHDREDNHVYLNGQLQITKLNADNMKQLAKVSGGRYFSYLDVQRDVQVLKKYIASEQLQHGTDNTVKTWNDGYGYILILAAALIVLAMRQGVLVLSIGVVLLLPINDSQALELAQWFKNNNQRAYQAFEKLDFANAAQLFSDPYNQGVSLYKAGKYELALEAFKHQQRPEVNIDALYNSGNAYYNLEKYKSAITSYEKVLSLDSDHADAKFNLELARKKLQEQPEDQKDKDCGCDDKKDDPNAKDDDKNKDQQQDPAASQDKSSQQDHQDKQDQGAAQSQPKDGQQESPTEPESKAAVPQDQAEPESDPATRELAANQAEQDTKASEQLAADQQQQKWLQRINSDISNFLKTRMYIDDLKSNK